MSKKKTTKQQKRKQKKAQRRKKRQAHRPVERTSQSGQQIMSDWTEELQGEERFEDAQFIINPAGEEKMSDALLDIVGDLYNMATTKEEVEKLLMLAAVAWNATLMDSKSRRSFLNDTVTGLDLDDETHADLLSVTMEMMAAKRQLHPTNGRYILNVKVVDQGDNFHVSVVSTLEPPQ